MKVGIYLRKSRAEDGIQDLKKHKDHLVKICNEKGWLYELYEEIDSSQDINREELQRLKNDIALGIIDAVMVHAVDRLSRRSRHFLEIVEDYFLAQGMSTLYERDVEHNLLDTTTITLLQIKATLSQAEYSFIVARLNEGRKTSANKGIWSGKLVFGYMYDKDNKKILPDPNEFPIVRKIADMLLEGYTYGAICTDLNRLNYRTRKGNEFEVHNIKSIIHSPFIRGHVLVNWKNEQTIVKNSHEAVISDAEYEKIRQLLDRRTEQYTRLSVAPKHFLQGLIRCSNCGLSFVLQANKVPDNKYPEGTRTYEGYRYYIKKCRGKNCVNYGSNIADVEDIIKEVLKDHVSTIMDEIETLKVTNKDELKKSHTFRKKELEKAISKLDSKEESLLDLLLDGTIKKELYNKRINSLKEEKARLLNEFNALPVMDLEQEEKHAEHIIDLIKRYEDLDGQDKRRLIQMAFSRITYSRFSKKESPTLDFYAN